MSRRARARRRARKRKREENDRINSSKGIPEEQLPPLTEASASVFASNIYDETESDIEAFLYPPMPTLPPEILCEIFLAVVALYPASARNLGAPAFARVCQQWRDVAFGFPPLWTTVNLCIDLEDTCFSLYEIEPYILLSAQLPLHVRLVGLGDWQAGEYRPGHEIHDYLVDGRASEALRRVAASSASRWKTLSVTGDLRVFAEQVEYITPLLESVEIYPWTWPEGYRGQLPLGFVQHPPLLRTLTLHAGFPTVLLPAWRRQVTSATYVLHEMGSAPDLVERHLADSDRLETLYIDGTDGDPFTQAFEEHPWDTVHHMNTLKTLGVSGCATMFLAVIAAPALEALTVSDAVIIASELESEIDPFSLMLGLLERSTLRTLRTLILRNIDSDEGTLGPLYQLLGDLDTLHTLRVEDDRAYRQRRPSLLQGGLLEWLTNTSSSLVRLPHLTHLTLLFGSHRVSGAEDLVRRLLALRRMGNSVEGTTMKTLTHFTSDLGPEYQIP